MSVKNIHIAHLEPNTNGHTSITKGWMEPTELISTPVYSTSGHPFMWKQKHRQPVSKLQDAERAQRQEAQSMSQKDCCAYLLHYDEPELYIEPGILCVRICLLPCNLGNDDLCCMDHQSKQLLQFQLCQKTIKRARSSKKAMKHSCARLHGTGGGELNFVILMCRNLITLVT